ncbi:hypothetical protein BROC_01153 [Candidatus Brocadiaceae bacterium]|nr:hypothetical protein BROC_01153 [Candidatus Brocadiaceae bacterium]
MSTNFHKLTVIRSINYNSLKIHEPIYLIHLIFYHIAYKKNLIQIVNEINKGNDESLFKAIRINKSVMYTKPVMERITKAQINGDKELNQQCFISPRLCLARGCNMVMVIRVHIHTFSNPPIFTPISLTFFFNSNLFRQSKAAVLVSSAVFVGTVRVFALVWVSKSLNLTFTVTVLPL